MSDTALRRVGIVLWLNLAAFLAATFILGGDAINGRRGGGHYYLGSHGRLTEVTFPIYLYSYVHAVASIIGICGFILITKLLNAKRR